MSKKALEATVAIERTCQCQNVKFASQCWGETLVAYCKALAREGREGFKEWQMRFGKEKDEMLHILYVFCNEQASYSPKLQCLEVYGASL